MREGYKKTELGEIPVEWEVRELSDITSVITKGTTPTTYGYSFLDEGINFIKIESINDLSGTLNKDTFAKISEECHQKLSRSILEEDDVLFAIAGATVGKCVRVTKENLPANTNQALAIIRLNKDCNDTKFIFQQLRSAIVQSKIDNIKSNTAQPNLNLKQIGEFKVILPTLKEQKKISDILATVDIQIDQTDKLIEKTKELKKGLMQKLLTKGIGHREFRKTEVGEIPVEWEVKKLSELVMKITDGTHKTPQYTEEGIPFLRVTDIQKKEIDWKNTKFISQEEHLELIKRCNPEIGDILYSKNGTIGIPKIINWDKTFSIFVSLCLIKVKKDNSEIDNKFLSMILESKMIKKQIRWRSKQGTVTNLHLEEIRDFLIIVPQLEEQKQIVEILSAVNEKIEQYEDKKEKLQQLKKGLMQQLLTGKIRV